MTSVTANVLIRNEASNVDGLIRNLIDSDTDQIVVLDGGSSDGSWELLQEWAERDARILLLRWPQPLGSEYRSEFKEVTRRNLMIEASRSDYIVYIDADERISLDYKNFIPRNADCVAVSFTSFWGCDIRVNGWSDSVWSPDFKFRIFKNSPEFRFKSGDPNGLHNYLAWRGVKIPLGITRGGWRPSLAKLLRGLLGINGYVPNLGPRIFHFHYYDLKRKKVNDLRSQEFAWPILRSGHTTKREKVVYVRPATDDSTATEIIKKYWQ